MDFDGNKICDDDGKINSFYTTPQNAYANNYP